MAFSQFAQPLDYSMLNDLMNKKIQQKQFLQQQAFKELEAKQRAKEAEDLNKYRQSELGISQASEARLQQLLPLQLKKSQLDISEAEQQQKFMKDLMESGNSTSLYDSLSSNQNQSAKTPESSSIEGMIMGQGSGGGFGGRLPTNQMPSPETSLDTLQQGQVMVTVPPQDQRKAAWDRFAGMKIGGIQIPAVQSRVDNGIEYKTYPSGMQVATKIGPSDMEKENIKIDAKASSDIRKSARELKAMHDRALKLRNLIEDNPNLTGIAEASKAKFNLSNNPKLGEFIQTMGKLQADIARYGSQRGGAQALKWAERMKPSEWRSGKFNLGMIDSLIKDAESDYESLNSEYQDMNHRPLSIKISASNGDGNQGETVTLDGQQYKLVNGAWHKIIRKS